MVIANMAAGNISIRLGARTSQTIVTAVLLRRMRLVKLFARLNMV